MDTSSNLLTDSEAANMLRMLPARVKRLAKQGLIPHVALPDGELRFDAEDLRRWILKHKRGNSSGETDR